ncbi:hypothetical protein DVA67_023945 [Solirubrobacter sp. CPCC 204708]|uniref:MFS transporter n=1 Tax=Solirubrobacter deserti TaxID=2282478 RepID=A0ABT4RKP0_9ACTN|nr:hypothetical protein [Solirubrobacter deserti]MBE2319048.1 hypothetical protein [Solirubrobacter deserti]MDA0139125.1 hypothetical protein [Solirubrobacter deserti]
MELMPARESRAWTLLLLGTASLVGVPLLMWRAQADGDVGEVVEIFLLMMAAGLLIVAGFSVWRTRGSLRRAQPAPEDAKVLAGSAGWRLLFVAMGVAGGLAPFGRDGPNEGDATFAAFGLGLVFGALVGVAVGLWYLRRREGADDTELLRLHRGKEQRVKYFVR